MKKTYTILLVEDDLELRRLYEIRLKKAGFKVETAKDGEEAVLKAVAINPDFMILDLMLPVQGGIQVMRIIRSNPYVKDLPILVLTAYDHFNYRKDAQPYVVDFMLKTETTPQKIVQKVQEYFESRDQHQSA